MKSLLLNLSVSHTHKGNFSARKQTQIYETWEKSYLKDIYFLPQIKEFQSPRSSESGILVMIYIR